MSHRTCPDCGSRLDPNEICDCKKEDLPDATGKPSGGNAVHYGSALTLADPYRDVNTLAQLKEIREGTGAMAKDVALVVQNVFPKFSRQLLSQAESWSSYGILIHPDGLRAICEAYGIQLPPPDLGLVVKVRKRPRRRLARKLTFRMTYDDYDALQMRVQGDGFTSIQSWLYAKITELLGGEANV